MKTIPETLNRSLRRLSAGLLGRPLPMSAMPQSFHPESQADIVIQISITSSIATIITVNIIIKNVHYYFYYVSLIVVISLDVHINIDIHIHISTFSY